MLTNEEIIKAYDWYDELEPNQQDSFLAKWIREYYEENIKE